MTTRDIHAMTRLLDDPDLIIYQQIEQQMIHLGHKIVPILEETWKNTRDMLVQNRIEHIIDSINFSDIIGEFNVWNNSSDPELMDALTIINRIQYPNVDCQIYYHQIDEKVRDIWLELNENLTAFEKVNVLNKVLFEIMNFRSVNENAYDEFQYNFLSNMMELKCGNQFTISCLYLLLAEKLDLPIYPVLLEDQLILAYVNSHKNTDDIILDDVMFYINPNEKGIVFDDFSIKRWIDKHKLDDKSSYYLPVDTKELVNIYINRLISGYEAEKDLKKVSILSSLRA
jgi:regulator of sirC expression with transglutaminase-like and TPR domain